MVQLRWRFGWDAQKAWMEWSLPVFILTLVLHVESDVFAYINPS